ncbi:uncharacterized protein EDB91DRAFT_1279244 [Suillus paluster]|uniref:uncharacterized protein n=1 Tax=Suillus paluster TaxID=48578 RepID=UPI001B879CC4|nr:uncharacterized protein EDB91DRAFT_1279244 [Suillus paluster]KAG1742306.1 hypothetical protein EDB91DRAFT_1279244 [Suillus paluster]
MFSATVTLPGYPTPSSQAHSPTYTAAPQAHEYRLAHDARLSPNRSPREFVKQTRNGGVSLRLAGQDDQTALPVYGYGASVEGTLDIHKRDGITSVEVQIEGTLMLEESAEGGTTNCKLCLNKSILWVKDRIYEAPCPRSLSFCLPLPTTFSDGGKTYPLPPTHESHLSGLPGFRARVDYSISVIAVKPNIIPHAVKSSLLWGGDWAISTPFEYLPRTRPSTPIPPPLVPGQWGIIETPQWKVFPTLIHANRGGHDIMVKLFIPASRTFCMNQSIPFHIMFSSSAMSLAAFMPLGPMVATSPKKQRTRIQLLRQTTVDVRNTFELGTRTDIWRIDCIGEGAFRHAGDGPLWVAFSGEIYISPDIKIGGFKAGGFSIKDCIVLTMTPPEHSKSAFKELRLAVPIRLATDPCSGSGLAVYSRRYGPPSISSSDELGDAPQLGYDS